MIAANGAPSLSKRLARPISEVGVSALNRNREPRRVLAAASACYRVQTLRETISTRSALRSHRRHSQLPRILTLLGLVPKMRTLAVVERMRVLLVISTPLSVAVAASNESSRVTTLIAWGSLPIVRIRTP